MRIPPKGAPPGAHDSHDLDPVEVLERDPHVLLDARFTGSLHAQLAEDRSTDEVAAALLRIGFLHGLSDATRACAAGDETGQVPPLAMQYRIGRRDGRTEVLGCWPERAEASARLGSSAADVCGCCALSAGYTSGWLSGMLELDLVAVERECSAHGSPSCRFVAREASLWRAEGGEPAKLADAIPFAADRELVLARETARRRPAAAAGDGSGIVGIDRGSACVHIWGPVMVLPFGGAEEGLRTLDLLGQDPEAQQVSVVVVDLGEAIIDAAFGALALELIVQAASSWGAEPLFAEPGVLAEPVLAELDHPPLMVLKGLEQAIATAFQIAAVQQHPV
jgi:hypothetical protein